MKKSNFDEFLKKARLKLKDIKKIIDSDLTENKTTEEKAIVEEVVVETEDVEKIDFKSEIKSVISKITDAKHTVVINSVLIVLIVMSICAMFYSFYAKNKVENAYTDVVNQSEKMSESNAELEDKINVLKPRYEMLSEEYEKLNNSAEEAKNADLPDVEETTTEATTANTTETTTSKSGEAKK
jgi:hypothetical protein